MTAGMMGVVRYEDKAAASEAALRERGGAVHSGGASVKNAATYWKDDMATYTGKTRSFRMPATSRVTR